MDRSVRENILVWLVFTALWLAAFAWSIRDAFILGVDVPYWWWHQLWRALLVGAVVQGVLFLLDASRRTKTFLYVLGIVVVGNLTSAWNFRRSIARFGPDRFMNMALRHTVLYAICCALVLGLLWLLRKRGRLVSDQIR